MLPPESTATGACRGRQFRGVKQPRRHRGRAARLRDQPGLTGQQPDGGEHLVIAHRDDVGHKLAEMRERQDADLLDPQRGPAIVRWVSAAGHADPLTTTEGVAGVRGEFWFHADHRGPRAGVARIAAAMPEISPPPLIGTRTRSTRGQSAAISRPMVPCPAITARSSNGGITTYPCLAESSSVAASRAAMVGASGNRSAP